MEGDDKNSYLIAVGLDGSDSSWKAFREAVQQAKLKGGALHLVSVQDADEPTFSATEALAEERHRHELERIQMQARLEAESAGIHVEGAIVDGRSAPALVEYVKSHAINLLIVGDTGHSSIWGALLGTTAEKIVRNARCSVLVVR